MGADTFAVRALFCECTMSEQTAPRAGLMNIGEEAKPPSVVLPDPEMVFLNRAKRLEALASGHTLEPFLRLVAAVCRAQAVIQAALPAVQMPAIADLASEGLPPLRADAVKIDAIADETLAKLARALADAGAPPAFKSAVTQILDAGRETRLDWLKAAIEGIGDGAGDASEAVRVLALAALQVHFARLASRLDADKVAPVSHGGCPVCGSAPTASAVVNWPQANNTRFCTCSLCATQWHVVRLKCVTCGTTKGISYPRIEGHPDALRAETCDDCRSYVKIVYQVKDPAMEPFADDIASLDLDLVLKKEGWSRGGVNPFLLGY